MRSSRKQTHPSDPVRQDPSGRPVDPPEATAKPAIEVGYGAQTHKAGEDFSHRAPWRKEQDAESRRGPADSTPDTDQAQAGEAADSAPKGEAA